MAEKHVSKVIYFGETLIDLTGDTVDPEHLLVGKTAHDRTGAIINGQCEYDAYTSDATAKASEVLSGSTAYVSGKKVTGTMVNHSGMEDGVISTKTGKYTIPSGYHDGSGKVGIDQTEIDKLVPDNIRQGISILGVTGSMSGTEEVNAQSMEVTPQTTPQTYVPTGDYNYLSQVTVLAIPYTKTDNAQGGLTVTIGH